MPYASSQTEISFEWLNGGADMLRIEVVMFNCPQWDIGAQTIQFIIPGKSGVISSIQTTDAASCDSLVTLCLTLPAIQFSRAQLQFVLFPSTQFVSIAEVRFFTDGHCPITGPVATNVESLSLLTNFDHVNSVIVAINVV